MPDAYVIEISGRTAGIVARDPRDLNFNFFAATHSFNAMEGQRFSDPLAAERAARHLAKHGSLPRASDQAERSPAEIKPGEA
jgi:hypothetical protein